MLLNNLVKRSRSSLLFTMLRKLSYIYHNNLKESNNNKAASIVDMCDSEDGHHRMQEEPPSASCQFTASLS